MSTDADAIATLARLIEGIETAMLTTTDGDGRLRSRPMVTQQAAFDGDLWFFSGRDTHKAEEIAARPQVCVSYADAKRQRYISISGTASLVDDREKMRALWSPTYQAWFPGGVDDPDLVLLRVRVERAEYWASPGAAAGRLIAFLQLMTNADRAHVGEHEEVEIRR